MAISTKLAPSRKNVTQLVEASRTGPENVSKHLAIFKQSGMIATRREGLSTMCSIADPTIFQLCEIMYAKLDSEHAARSRHLKGL